jgi:hypothetical protein
MTRNRILLCPVAVLVIAVALGCKETPKPRPEPMTKPTTEPKAPEPPIATAPAVAPEAPAKPPKPTYEHKPPYRVDMTIDTPEAEQPGWIRIEAFADEKQPATAHGVFPEQNKIRVDTENVAVLSIDIDMLPLKAKTRRILQIDGQGIELSQRHRGHVVLKRSTTGDWSVITKPPKR